MQRRPRAVGVRRGSTTISLPPLSLLGLEVLHDRRHRLGQVAADEQDDVGVRDIVERKRQPAIESERRVASPPPRTTCRSARCSRCSRCAAPPARTCRAGRPSRWSATRRRRRRPRHGRARCCTSLKLRARCDRAPRPSWPAQLAVRRSRTSGVVSRSGCASVAAGRPSFDAEAALVDWKPGVPQYVRRFRSSRDEHAALQRAVRAMGRDGAMGVWLGIATDMSVGCPRAIRPSCPALAGP